MFKIVPLCMVSCTEELPFVDPTEPSWEYCEHIFLNGIKSHMKIGQRDTVSLEWASGIPPFPSTVRMLKGTGILSMESQGSHSVLTALCEGKAILRAEVGNFYRDFIIHVEAYIPDDSNRDYVSSTRVGIGGLPDSFRVWTWNTYAAYVLFDGKAIFDGRARMSIEGGKADLRYPQVAFFSPGIYILTAMIDSSQGNIIFFTQRAVYAYQHDRILLYVDHNDDSSDTLGNSSAFMSVSTGGQAADLSISISIRSSSGASRQLYSCTGYRFEGAQTVQVADYSDISGFVMKHIGSNFSLVIDASCRNEYHLLSVDCSYIVELVRKLAGMNIDVIINQKKAPMGIIEQTLPE